MRKEKALLEIESVEEVGHRGWNRNADAVYQNAVRQEEKIARQNRKDRKESGIAEPDMIKPPHRSIFMGGERIRFSKWTQEDEPLAQELWGDPQVTKYLCASGIFTPEEIRDRLETEIRNEEEFGVQYWPIFDLSYHFLGCCGLRPYPKEKDSYELGFHVKSSCWGKRYGTEAANTAIFCGLYVLNAKALFAGHHPENTASAEVLKRIGFTYSHDELYEPTGLYHPTYIIRK